jgi:2-aminomuconate deaminase
MSLPNGTAYFLPPLAAQGLANYPHARTAPGTRAITQLYVSGTSSRKGDSTIAGYAVDDAGVPVLDAAEQTSAVLSNIQTIIHGATNGACGLESIIDATIFLTDMKDYGKMNGVWNSVFPDRKSAPARTCVQVAALPNEKLCVEIKCTAVVPVVE